MTASINFPSQIPCFLRDGYENNHVSPFFRSELVSGRSRQRRAFTSVPTMVSANLLLTDQQAQVFEAWFRYEALDGAEWFNASLKTPLGLMPYECRFVEMYSGPTLTGNSLWKFSCKLEIRDRQIISSNWYQYGADFIMYSDIIDIAINREWPAA